MRALVAIAVVLSAALVPAAQADSRSAPRTERLEALESAIVRELNRVRIAHDLPRVQAAPSLDSAAGGHSRAMLEHDFFGHNSADGTAFGERIRRYYTNRGWQTWSVGEALLASPSRTLEAAAIIDAWLDSPPHRHIILSSRWRDAGIGAIYASSAPRTFGGGETIVVTADFGQRDGKLASS